MTTPTTPDCMSALVDLSHAFEDGMPGFRMAEDDGTVEFTAEIRPFRTHAEMARHYDEGVSFEITEIRFKTSVGTYLDSPYHRYPDRRDVGSLGLEEVVRPGVAVDARGAEPGEAVGPEVLPEADLAGRAVLFCFGWDDHWGTEAYYEYPFVSEELVTALLEHDAGLVGVDTLNVDDHHDPARPTHSRFLAEDVLIVENLANVDAVLDERFRFFAAPLKAKGAAAMPVRAFAEVD